MVISNVVLIGFMGSGKSAVSMNLARLLSFKCVDSDKLVEIQSGKSIAALFSESESYFRSWEQAVIKGLSKKKNMIVSTGGGVVTHEPSMTLLKQLGPVIYLRASVDTIYKRTRHNKDRPLLNVDDPMTVITELLSKRAESYEHHADLIIDVDHMSIHEISATIINNYEFLDVNS